jgi:hypothetical protein
MIQSKFETPILNFGSTPTGSVTLASSVAGAPIGRSSADEISTRGMWHQYGAIPTGSTAGVSVKLEHPAVWSTSLARICGFSPSAQGKNIGELRDQFIFEEAVVAIPFTTFAGQRQFIERPATLGLPQQAAATALDKYVFPPRFDSNRDSTVTPVLMYVFEFSATLSSTDLADIWQNLPPSIGEKFVSQTVTIEEKTYKDLILDAANPIQWMVFKVKKRAPIDFERNRRAQVVDVDAAAGLFPATVGDWSYNWPYDYFSLVELAKIDEEVTYASKDIQDEEPMVSAAALAQEALDLL